MPDQRPDQRPSSDGLTSEPLRKALAAALNGQDAPLQMLLCRYGSGSDRQPNLRLAAAFGAELASAPGPVARLLARLAANDAAPDTVEVFLPIAAAHGWAARLSAARDVREAWAALAELAADERAPVRLGTREALLAYALRPSGAQELVRSASDWLDIEDLDSRLGAAAVVVEVLGDRRVLTALGQEPAPLDYLSRVMAEVVGAPRSAERSAARRRLLSSLPPTLAAVVATLRTADRGPAWLESECLRTRHPDVRAALSEAILSLRTTHHGQGAALTQRLRKALEGSAKPPRDPTRRRPGTGRGKASRRMR
jgi:hypothetical protein